jgi:hypothetical protein
MSTLADYRHPPRIRRLLASVTPIACPPDVEELGIIDAVVDHVELSMRSLPAVVRAALLAGLTSYELGSIAWPGNWGRPASKLGRARAIRYYDAWRRSPIRLQTEFIKGLKGLLCMSYYEMPQVKERLGYTPDPWVSRVKRRRLEVYGDEIRRHQATLFQPEPLPPLPATARPMAAGVQAGASSERDSAARSRGAETEEAT